MAGVASAAMSPGRHRTDIFLKHSRRSVSVPQVVLRWSLRMRTRPVAAAVAAVLGALSVAGCSDSNNKNEAVTKVDFIGMDAPATAEQKADMYSERQGRLHVRIGPTAEYQLQYHKIFDTTTTVGGNVVGGLYSAVRTARRQRRTDGVRRPRRHLADDGQRPVGAGRHRQSAGDGHAVRVQVAAAERRCQHR